MLLAHGIGGQEDLPVPFGIALTAASIAVVASFVVLAFAWRTPRFHGARSGVPLPSWLARVVDSRALRGALVTAGLLFTGWVTMAAWFGAPVLVNPTFGVVYAWLWVGLVPAALLFGRVYRLCNPLRWLHRAVCLALYRAVCLALRRDPGRPLIRRCPEAVGLWPAALGLLAFVWLELANPAYSQNLTVIRWWFVAVAVAVLAGALVFGEGWVARADPFEVYSSLVARLSPFARRDDGVLVVRNPLQNLDTTPAVPGLIAVVSVLFGSTAFDSFSGSSRWIRVLLDHPSYPTLLNTLMLVGFCLVVMGSLVAASWAAAALGRVGPRQMARQLAPSVLPIVVGYIVAHYLTFFWAVGIQTWQRLGDPLSMGWSLTAVDAANTYKYALLEHPTAVAVTKVVAVVVGHVLAVVAAHDRSVRLLPRRRAVIGQVPLLVLMVGYTLTGLWLLFSS